MADRVTHDVQWDDVVWSVSPLYFPVLDKIGLLTY
jgi:hypothetical protein